MRKDIQRRMEEKNIYKIFFLFSGSLILVILAIAIGVIVYSNINSR